MIQCDNKMVQYDKVAVCLHGDMESGEWGGGGGGCWGERPMRKRN